MTTKSVNNTTAMPATPPHRGGGWEGVSPIKNREQFFKLVEEGLQQYFDTCDRYWGGILHLTVGVKCGEVGGIIKSADAFGASVATTEGLSSQRSLPPPRLSYEGFTLHRVETILKYVLPRFVSRDSVPYAIAAVLDELRVEGTHPNPPCEGGDTALAEME